MTLGGRSKSKKQRALEVVSWCERVRWELCGGEVGSVIWMGRSRTSARCTFAEAVGTVLSAELSRPRKVYNLCTCVEWLGGYVYVDRYNHLDLTELATATRPTADSLGQTKSSKDVAE